MAGDHLSSDAIAAFVEYHEVVNPHQSGYSILPALISFVPEVVINARCIFDAATGFMDLLDAR